MKKHKIYLDNCCFNRPYDNQAQDIIMLETTAKLMIQNLVLENKISLVWSYVLTYENSKNPYKIKKNSILSWRELSEENITHKSEIEEMAEEITRTGIKAFDALHVACAIHAKCDFFITVDRRILKYKNENIIICNPMEFMSIYEEREQL